MPNTSNEKRRAVSSPPLYQSSPLSFAICNSFPSPLHPMRRNLEAEIVPPKHPRHFRHRALAANGSQIRCNRLSRRNAESAVLGVFHVICGWTYPQRVVYNAWRADEHLYGWWQTSSVHLFTRGQKASKTASKIFGRWERQDPTRASKISGRRRRNTKFAMADQHAWRQFLLPNSKILE